MANYFKMNFLRNTVPISCIQQQMQPYFQKMAELCEVTLQLPDPLPQFIQDSDLLQHSDLKPASYNLLQQWIDDCHDDDTKKQELKHRVLALSQTIGYWIFNEFYPTAPVHIPVSPGPSSYKAGTTMGVVYYLGIDEGHTSVKDSFTATLLIPPFPVPDWSLDPEKYPTIFLVDEAWADNPKYRFAPRSYKRSALTGLTPLVDGKNHGERMLQVITGMTHNLSESCVTLVSLERDNFTFPGTQLQADMNLPEALLSIKMQLTAGDLVVINVEDSNGKSLACDELIGQHLQEITDKLNGIVVISSGNIPIEKLPDTFAPNAIVVGAVNGNSIAQSKYGPKVICYGIAHYNLPNLPPAYTTPVYFENSSATTAYLAGLVLMVLNYVRAKSILLSSEDIVSLLKENGQEFTILSSDGKVLDTGVLPDWHRLKQTLDGL